MSAELKATARERVGKGAARSLRRQGLVPAVVYGDNQPPVPVVLKYHDTAQAIQAGGFLSHVITLEVDGKALRVLPRDYQREPVRDLIMHVDFLRVSKTSRITVDVPVRFVNEGESQGLKRGGVLNIVRHTVEVTVPAEAIPESFTFDLTGLDIGDSVHISAIALPEDVRLTITGRDFTIATIAAPSAFKSEEEEAAEAAVKAAAAAVEAGVLAEGLAAEGEAGAVPAEEAKADKKEDKPKADKKSR